jgi:epoxide hydrolase-like predicted phosphatase
MTKIKAVIFDFGGVLVRMVDDRPRLKLAEQLGVPISRLDEYWSADDVNWALLAFIKGLHPHYKVGLLSNAWDDLRRTMHERWNMAVLFDDLVISAEVSFAKPDPRIYRLALERLHVQPEEAVFVDDMLVNVEAARQQGLSAIQFLDTQQTLADLRSILAG